MRFLFVIFGLFSIGAFGAQQSIVLAGGCFWCMEKPFEQIDGVESVISGYAQGSVDKPTYSQVSSGTSGHLEVVKVNFDDKKVSLQKILFTFWQQINPTDSGGQFVDRGPQYATGIFVSSPEQKKVAQESLDVLAKTKIFSSIVTPIEDLKKFFAAEDYHQDYYKKNSVRYWYYRSRSGRDSYLEGIWTKGNKEKWAKAYPFLPTINAK